MSDGLNMVFLLGNLGADPELLPTAGGSRLKMRLATSETYFDKDRNKKERVEWHTVKVFGARAEGLFKILAKGTRIQVTGRIETSSWEKDGSKRYSTEIMATDIIVLDGPKKPRTTDTAAATVPAIAAARRSGSFPEAATTDIPF